MLLEYKIDLIKAFIQVEGKVKLNGTTYNYDDNEGVEFTGYKDGRIIKYAISKLQVEDLKCAEDIINIYETYKEMEFFKEM